MRKLIMTIALLALVDTSVSIAQTAGSRNPCTSLDELGLDELGAAIASG
jgi:hypothetical protein